MYLGYHGDNKLPAALSHLTPVTDFCSHDFPLLFGSKLQISEKDAPQPCHGIKKVFNKIDINQCQFSTLISYHGYELMGEILNTWARLFMTFSVRCHDINETLQIMNRDILVSADISTENISLIQLIVSLLLIFLVAKYVLQIEKHQQSTFK